MEEKWLDIKLTPENWGEVLMDLQQLQGISLVKLAEGGGGISLPTVKKFRKGDNRSVNAFLKLMGSVGATITVSIPRGTRAARLLDKYNQK